MSIHEKVIGDVSVKQDVMLSMILSDLYKRKVMQMQLASDDDIEPISDVSKIIGTELSDGNKQDLVGYVFRVIVMTESRYNTTTDLLELVSDDITGQITRQNVLKDTK